MLRKSGVSVPQPRLAATIAAQCPGMSIADAENLLQVVIRSIAAEVRATGDATIGGLGRFRVVRRPARNFNIPGKAEIQQVEARTVLTMKPSKHFAARCFNDDDASA